MNDYIGMSEAARLVSRAEGPPAHPATVTKWVRFGVATPTGRVHLRAVKLGTRWATKRDWLDQFCDAVTAASVEGVGPVVVTPAARNEAADAAVEELKRLGIAA